MDVYDADDDRCPSRSGYKFVSLGSGRGCWLLEIRSQRFNHGGVVLGELVLSGVVDKGGGQLTARIPDE
jgi:hypothetical protein